MRAAGREYVRDYALYFAGAVVYYALLSLMPLLVLALAALGWLLRFSDVAADVERRMLRQVAATFGDEMRVTAEHMLGQLEQGSLIATLVGVAGIVLTASALFRHLRMTFRALWHLPPPLAAGSLLGAIRATLLERAIAFGIVLGGGATLLAMLLTVAGLQWLVARTRNLPLLSDTLHWVLALPASVVIASLSFGLLYKFLAPAPLRWRDVWLAAVLASLAWIGGAELMTLYALHAVDAKSAYGAVGGVLVIMLWMHVVGKVLFFGAELCKVSASARNRPQ